MKHATSTTIATVLTVTLAAATVHADGFDQPATVGSAGRVYGAAGTHIPVFDEHGQRTGEQVFLLHGGYPAQLNAEPISDLWALADGYWQHLGAAAPAMADHTLVAAADGRAWAVGAIGEDGWLQPITTLAAFEVRRVHGRLEVDVQSVEVSGPAPDACFGQAYASADSGRSILSVGGSCLGNPLNPTPGELWEYEIDTNRWSRRTDLPVDISGHSAVTVRDFVWVFGGTIQGESSNAVHRYDLLADRWIAVDIEGDGPAPRRSHGAVAAGRFMVVFGGIDDDFFPETLDDVWQLDLDTLRWNRKQSMPSNLSQMAVGLIPRQLRSSHNAEVLIYGGVTDAWSFPYDVSNDTVIYTSDIRGSRAGTGTQGQTQLDR